ncbi:ESX secretion-associated protein EspG [Nocardia sp. NEAU-G5]|uniref:ESX secretion-associated protein EspG n=1 Tax=Nocardia albiluteola TaxID=2842303 RepID=A0ABS6BCS2_9NOCA|nr:ESX secretion-associated protein EspG [Nocardia albiluteola]MBU3068087.1 ESX secretion-associated protein EspG [Nocardia albiluteola]
MSESWSLTDVELIVLWDSLFGEGLPTPLFALQRGSNVDDWAVLAAGARAALRARDDGALYDALTRVARADALVRLHAIDPADHEDPLTRLRVLGARQGAMAVLIHQLPGETVWHSGGFTITMGEAERLAGAMAGTLPPCPAASGPEIPLVSRRSGRADHRHGHSPARADYLDAERRSTAWLAHPADRAGAFEIVQGSSIFGPRGIIPHRVSWRDMRGVGRYAVAESAEPVAVPADRHRLAAMIDAEIAKVLQTLEDERCA